MRKKILSSKFIKERRLGIIMALPAVFFIALVMLFPMAQSFWISLHDWEFLQPASEQIFSGFDNYLYILKDSAFQDSFRLTMIFTVSAVVLEMVLALAIALLLNRDFWGRGFVRTLALLPWAVPSVVNGIMWKWMLNPRYGALNGLLAAMGLIDRYIIWLGDKELAMFMVILADVWKETPFIMLLILAALQTIPKDLYEASKVDGANKLQNLFYITIPLIQPVIFVSIALRTIWALKSFDLIYTLTAGGPSNGTTVMGYYTYLKAFISLDFGKGSAVAYIMTLLVLVLVVIYQKLIYKEVNN
ncbi:MAG: sugar ABC transporter permease [Anaerolineaceae bacterium]|nr:sugar ABC transporter permease [Anaerolineaceae bacterium]